MKEFSNLSDIDTKIQEYSLSIKEEIEKESALLREVDNLVNLKNRNESRLEELFYIQEQDYRKEETRNLKKEINRIDDKIQNTKAELNSVKDQINKVYNEINSTISSVEKFKGLSNANLDLYNEIAKIDKLGFMKAISNSFSSEQEIVTKLQNYISRLKSLKNEVYIQKEYIKRNIKSLKRTFRNSSKSYKFLKKTLKGIGKVLESVITPIITTGIIFYKGMGALTRIAMEEISYHRGQIKESGLYKKTGRKLRGIVRTESGNYKSVGNNKQIETIKQMDNLKIGAKFYDLKKGSIIKEKGWATHYNIKGGAHISIEKFPEKHPDRHFDIGKDWTIDNDILWAKKTAPGFFEKTADELLNRSRKINTEGVGQKMTSRKSSKPLSKDFGTNIINGYGLTDSSFNQRSNTYNYKWGNTLRKNISKETMTKYGLNSPDSYLKVLKYNEKWTGKMKKPPQNAYEYYRSIGAYEKADEYFMNRENVDKYIFKW